MDNPFDILIHRIGRIETMILNIEKKLKVLTERPNETDDELGNVHLASKITGLAVSTIYTLTSQRKIPYMKQGKTLFFSKKDLLNWIEEGRRKTTKDMQADVAFLIAKKGRA